MTQQRTTLLVGDPGSLEPIRGFQVSSAGISFPDVAKARKLPISAQQRPKLGFPGIFSFPSAHAHERLFGTPTVCNLPLSSLILWLAEASLLPSHHVEGTLPCATGPDVPLGARWPPSPLVSRALGQPPSSLGKGLKLSISRGTAQKPEGPRTQVLWFPFA